MFFDHPSVSGPTCLLCLALTLTLAPGQAAANPEMVPQRTAREVFGPGQPVGVTDDMDEAMAAFTVKQAQLNKRYLQGSLSCRVDFFAKTLTVRHADRVVVFDADHLGAYTLPDQRWTWAVVNRQWNDPDLKDKRRMSFATGAALTRQHGRDHGIALLTTDPLVLPEESAAWYLCALATDITDATGVLVLKRKMEPWETTAGPPNTHNQSYFLQSHPKEQPLVPNQK